MNVCVRTFEGKLRGAIWIDLSVRAHWDCREYVEVLGLVAVIHSHEIAAMVARQRRNFNLRAIGTERGLDADPFAEGLVDFMRVLWTVKNSRSPANNVRWGKR